MQFEGNCRVLLFVLEIIWKHYFRLRNIIGFALRGDTTSTGVDEVSDVVIAGKVWHFFVVDNSLDGLVY